MRARRQRRDANGVMMAVACVALAATLYLVGALVWDLDDDEEAAAPRTRFTMAVD